MADSLNLTNPNEDEEAAPRDKKAITLGVQLANSKRYTLLIKTFVDCAGREMVSVDDAGQQKEGNGEEGERSFQQREGKRQKRRKKFPEKRR